MALISKENIAHATQLGIWKKEESLELLESVYILNDAENEAYSKITNESRKKEWLTTRILLTELLEKRTDISYNTNRKPILSNHSSNITISHSRNFVVIILSASYYPGVDVEYISDRVAKVKHKFLNNRELEWCKNIEQMTACWSAKEAVFKIFEKNLDFHDMEIAPFIVSSNGGSFKATILKPRKQGSYSVKYRVIENDILTYTLSKSVI